MCIRDSIKTAACFQVVVLDELGFIPFSATGAQLIFQFCSALHEKVALIITCLLYTSDAADERSSVDLGGRRIIKKKKTERTVQQGHN